MHTESYPEEQVGENPALTNLFEDLYTGKQDIYPASFNMPANSNPSDFLCSGGSSSYFVQPIDRDKRADLKTLYVNTWKRLHQVEGPFLSNSEVDQVFQLKWELKMRLELLANTDYLRPIDGSTWSTLPQFLQDASGEGRYSMRSEEDFEHAADRIQGFAEWADIAVYNMDDAIRGNETMARCLGERALRVMTGHLTNNACGLRDAFTRPFHDATISPTQQESYSKLVDTVVVPTYAMLYRYMQSEYMPYCKDDDQLGLFYMHNGPEQYERLVRYHTSDAVTVEQVAAVAQEDYHESLGLLEALAHKLGFDSAAAITRFLLNDTTPHEHVRPFKDVSQVASAYTNFAQRVNRGLSRIFLPQDMPNPNWQILPVTDHTAAMTIATYTKASGIFRAPIPNAAKYNAARIPKLFLHEVNPGHHAQNSVYDQLELPDFLRYAVYYPGVHEGWSMYAETLAPEIDTPFSDWEHAARLCSKVSTAALALVDIGIHHTGWSLQEARQHAQELIPGYDVSQENIFLLRDAEWPAQIHSYVYGEIAIRGIRQAAEDHIRRPFSLQEFHSMLLRAGQQPLTLLRQKTMLELVAYLYDDVDF
jgi:uncharacterized protein (DUF885 family)